MKIPSHWYMIVWSHLICLSGGNDQSSSAMTGKWSGAESRHIKLSFSLIDETMKSVFLLAKYVQSIVSIHTHIYV